MERGQEEGKDIRRLGGLFGVKVVFTVSQGDWHCIASLPPFLPVSQSQVEAMFDEQFSGLKDL